MIQSTKYVSFPHFYVCLTSEHFIFIHKIIHCVCKNAPSPIPRFSDSKVAPQRQDCLSVFRLNLYFLYFPRFSFSFYLAFLLCLLILPPSFSILLSLILFSSINWQLMAILYVTFFKEHTDNAVILDTTQSFMRVNI